MPRRRRPVVKRKKKSTSFAEVKPSSTSVDVDEILPAAAKEPRAVGSCAIACFTFEEALRVEPLLRGIGHAHINQHDEFLRANGGDLLNGGLQGARCLVEKGTYLVRFAPDAAKRLGTKELHLVTNKTTGKLMPMLANSKNEYAAHAQMAGKLTKGTKLASSTVTAIVSAAHIISGADVCRKLETVSDKADFLVAVHRISQLAQVEGVYRQAKELAYLGLNDRTQCEIHRLGRELFEVRSAWRRELLYHLGKLKKKGESKKFLLRFFQGRAVDKHDKKTAASIVSGMVEIQLINASMAIHLALAQAAQTTDIFLGVTLRDELEDLRLLSERLHKSRTLINTRNQVQRRQAKEVCECLDGVREAYSEMLRPKPPQPSLSEVYSPASLPRLAPV
jgi:hypothetical protein